MSKQDSSNISPLHRQRVKQRTIIITEDPKLHLVWIYDHIFIKPLPRYLGSYTFWTDYLCAEAGSGGRGTHIRPAALGFLRTYYHLVKHESDFRIAQDPCLCLIPAEITWEQFCEFTSSLDGIADRDVSLRYAYGEIRLTRLNFYAPFLLGKSHFQKVEYQYGTYFAAFLCANLVCDWGHLGYPEWVTGRRLGGNGRWEDLVDGRIPLDQRHADLEFMWPPLLTGISYCV